MHANSRTRFAASYCGSGKALLPKTIISQAAYDTRRNEMDAAVSALDSAEAQLRQATNAVGYATLKADKVGTVTAVMGEPGQVVSAGQTVITLTHAGETEIAIAVPRLDQGGVVTQIMLPVLALTAMTRAAPLVHRKQGRCETQTFAKPLESFITDVILASWCGKKVVLDKIRQRSGWDAIPAIRNCRIVEIKSALILQLGPAALTDGLDAILAALRHGK